MTSTTPADLLHQLRKGPQAVAGKAAVPSGEVFIAPGDGTFEAILPGVGKAFSSTPESAQVFFATIGGVPKGAPDAAVPGAADIPQDGLQGVSQVPSAGGMIAAPNGSVVQVTNDASLLQEEMAEAAGPPTEVRAGEGGRGPRRAMPGADVPSQMSPLGASPPAQSGSEAVVPHLVPAAAPTEARLRGPGMQYGLESSSYGAGGSKGGASALVSAPMPPVAGPVPSPGRGEQVVRSAPLMSDDGAKKPLSGLLVEPGGKADVLAKGPNGAGSVGPLSADLGPAAKSVQTPQAPTSHADPTFHTVMEAKASPPDAATPQRTQSPAPLPADVQHGIRTQISGVQISEGRTRVELTPRGLGDIEIDLRQDGGQLRVVLRVENPAVLAGLRQDRDGIVAMLRDGGVELGDNALAFESFDGHRSRGQSNPDGQPSMSGRPASPWAMSQDAATDADLAENRVQRGAVPSARLDLLT